MDGRWGGYVPIVSGALVSAVIVGIFHYTFFSKKEKAPADIGIQSKPEE